MSNASELRKEAQEHMMAAERSFERCDTDGFLTQYAHGLSADKKMLQADIEERGGTWPFVRLFKGDREVDAKMIRGKYGLVWMLSVDEEKALGRRFIPVDASQDSDRKSRSRVQVDLGLHQAYVELPAMAVIQGSGTGLSGSAWVTVVEKIAR